MDKTWLIRTKNNHILGPVSKEKVKELINKGSLKSEDEICSANGYWFFIREKDLVEKYIFGTARQGFNPVSEAQTILCKAETLSISDDDHLESNKALPSEDDLAYPDLEHDRDDLTITGISLDDLKEKMSEIEEEPVVDNDELYPDLEEIIGQEDTEFEEENDYDNELAPQDNSHVKVPRLNNEDISKKKQLSRKEIKQRNDTYLFYLAIVFLAIAISFFIYRKYFIKHFFDTSKSSISLIHTANAQITTPIIGVAKKKTIMSL